VDRLKTTNTSLINPDINGTEKTDVEVRAVSSGSNNLISANFSMVYIKNSSVDTNNYSP
jgi:hypothetical protein